MQMNRKRLRKTTLTMGKKSKKYYETRSSSQLEPNEIDFSQFVTFNVDFDEFMMPPVVSKKKDSGKRNQTTQTGVPVCTQTSQTSGSIFSHCTQTEIEHKPLPTTEITPGERLIKNLQMDNIWEKFAEKLRKKNQSDPFIKLITALATKKLLFDNLSWKCTLDMGKLSLCKSTTRMKYDPDCVEFFSLFALMFGSSAVDVLRGPANFSQVITEKTRRGLYDPQQGTFNFAIPSITTLKKVSSGYPKNIPVGLVEHSLCIVQEQAKEYSAQFILGFDGKLVAAGCKGENEGDINLWGRERPSLTETVKQLERNEELCNDIKTEIMESNIMNHSTLSRRLVYCVSERLRALRSHMNSAFYIKKRLVQSCKENPANQLKYMRRISLIHQNSADCEAVLKMGLATQKTLVKLISNEMHTECFFNAEHKVDLSLQANVFQLLPPEAMPESIDLSQ